LVFGGLLGCGAAQAQQQTDEVARTVEQLRKDQEALRAELSRLHTEMQAMQKTIADLKNSGLATGDVPLTQLDKKLDRILAEIQAVNKAKPATTQPFRPAATELVGRAAPAFSLTTIGGVALSNKEFAGYPATVLNFVAPNCGFCKRQIPKVEGLRVQYEPSGVRFVNMSRRMGQEFTVQEAQKAYGEMGSNLELATDSNNQVGQLFQATGYPTLVIVDSKGIIREVIVGAKPDLDQLVREPLDRLVSGSAMQKQAGAPVLPHAAMIPPSSQPVTKTPGMNP
jgi:thiol-disulfide isomerase/thioredoxin